VLLQRLRALITASSSASPAVETEVVHTAPAHSAGIRVAELSGAHKLTLMGAMTFGNVPARLMARLTSTLSFTVYKELQAQGYTNFADVGIDDIMAVVPTNMRHLQDCAAADSRVEVLVRSLPVAFTQNDKGATLRGGQTFQVISGYDKHRGCILEIAVDILARSRRLAERA